MRRFRDGRFKVHNVLSRSKLLTSTAAFALAPRLASAQAGPIKIGILSAFTTAGSQSTSGPQLEAAIAVFQKSHGDTIAGRKIEFIRRDTTGPNEEVVKREATELIIGDGVDMIIGLSFSPDVLTVGPVSTQAKKPVFVINAATDNVLAKAPYMARFSSQNGQMTWALAQWARKAGIKTVFNLTTDYLTGIDAANTFQKFFVQDGGTIVGETRPPLLSKEFTPYLERVKDAKPDAMFCFLGAGENTPLFLKEFNQLGLGSAGIKILAIGSVVEDDALDSDPDEAIGLISVFNYSGALNTKANKQFLAELAVLRGPKFRPNFSAYATYDVLTALYAVIGAQNGNVDPDRTMALVKGFKGDGPRGPFIIDPQTRDLVANMYIRRVEKRNGRLENTVIATVPMVRNPNENY
jgi:branched-chain amino acid transport system substrate-binding protein